MAKNSPIEWTDHTFNPWIGCTKVSPGCEHCYAETLMDHRYHKVKWGKGQPRVRSSADYWKGPVKWNREANDAEAFHDSEAPLHDEGDFPTYERPRVFCASLADWLDGEVPIEWLADLLRLIFETPHLDWLLLTKRPENFRQRLHEVRFLFPPGHPFSVQISKWIGFKPEFAQIPPNIWIGTTVEDQVRADQRIPELLKIPAKVRFLSCEPLLGPVDLTGWATDSAKDIGTPETWDEFVWPEWVTAEQRKQVEQFWSAACGRGPAAWRKDNAIQKTPAFGSVVGWDKRNHVCKPNAADAVGRGRFMHSWNNIGRVFTDSGDCIGVSSSRGPGWLDRWLQSGGYKHRIHWVIAGGESGPKARPLHPDWARGLRDQCAAAGVPFFFKQWGEWVPEGDGSGSGVVSKQRSHGGSWDGDIFVPGNFSVGRQHSQHLGKKAAGRLLDGVEHSAFPVLQMGHPQSTIRN